MIKKTSFIITSLFLITLLSNIYLINQVQAQITANDFRLHDTERNIYLSLGMTEDEIIIIYGEPEKTTYGDSKTNHGDSQTKKTVSYLSNSLEFYFYNKQLLSMNTVNPKITLGDNIAFIGMNFDQKNLGEFSNIKFFKNANKYDFPQKINNILYGVCLDITNNTVSKISIRYYPNIEPM